MEIIMKVKCAPNPGTDTPSINQTTLKILDQQTQLQQPSNFHMGNPTPPQVSTYSIPPLQNVGSECTAAASACSECNVGYCCNLPACCMTSPNNTSHHLPTPPPLLPLQQSATQQSPLLPPPPPYAACNTLQQVAEDQQPPEFVSIDDEKVKDYLMRFGQQQLEQQRQQRKVQQRHLLQQKHQREHQFQDISKTTQIYSENIPRTVVYEIIELDDEGEREKLKQIKQQAEQSLAIKKSTVPCIDINYAALHTKSLNISLIPKVSENVQGKEEFQSKQSNSTLSAERQKSNSSQHKIIAEISLIDSSDEEEEDALSNQRYNYDVGNDDDDDDDDMPLVAVSCELECDDDEGETEDVEDETQNIRTFIQNPSYRNLKISKARSIGPTKPLLEHQGTEDNLLVRWDEYENHKERVFFECFLCGKKVQSSYNLRRHMMIHTGERPFGCDMCDRRFREFSDLKKHRRRHVNEQNFLCMICRKFPPIEGDSTRCINCCTQSKNAVLEASIKLNEEKNSAETMARQRESKGEALPLSPKRFNESKSIPQKSLSSRKKGTENFVTPSPPPIFNSPSSPVVLALSNSPSDERDCNTSTLPSNITTSEETQSFLDKIPAVHRPGFNQLGMITRKEFPCPLCNRAFGTRHNLKRHFMIHTGEKPFSCTKCRKPFREYSTLKKHMVTHQRDRWYKCMRCPMKYRDFLKYTEHKESHAVTECESDEQNSERFFTNSNSRKRSKSGRNDNYIDSNEEDSISDDWLECCECSQRFHDINSYNEHVKEHTSVYQCYICKDEFETRSEMQEHLVRKHKNDMDSEEDEAMMEV